MTHQKLRTSYPGYENIGAHKTITYKNRKGKYEVYKRFSYAHVNKDHALDTAIDLRREGHKARVKTYWDRTGSMGEDWKRFYAVYVKNKKKR